MIGNIVGAGVLMMPASFAIYGNVGVLGWITTSFGAIMLSFVFASLSHRFSKTGGPYTYVKEVFGRFAGFQTAWIYWLANTISNIGLAIAFVSYLSNVYPIISSSPTYGFLLSFFCIWALMLLNCLGMAFFARIQLLVTFAKVIPLLLVAFIGVKYVDWNNLFPLKVAANYTWSQVFFSTASLGIFAFIGIESATIPSEHIQKPKKFVALATVLGTAFAALIYIWMQIVIMGILGAETLAQSTAPFAQAAGKIFGTHTAEKALALLAAFASFSTLNGWMLLQGQIPLAAARDHLLPPIFGRVSKKGAPVFSLFVSTILMSLLVYVNYQSSLVDQFTMILNLTSFSILLPYFLCSLAELKLIFSDDQPYHKKILPFLVTLGAISYAIIALIGVGWQSASLGGLLILLGLPLYWARKDA